MTNKGEFVDLLRRMARSHLGTASAAFDQAADEITGLQIALDRCVDGGTFDMVLDAAKFAYAAMDSEEGRRRAKDSLLAAISKATG